MNEWFENQKKPKSAFHNLLQEHVHKSNKFNVLTNKEEWRLSNH